MKNKGIWIAAAAVILAQAQITVSASETNIETEPIIAGTGDIKKNYGNILWQYLDVWETPDISLEMREESSIVNYLLYYGDSSGDETLTYSLMDIDGNGTEELLIGLGYSGGNNLIDIFTYTDGKIVHLLEGAERVHLSMCKDGIISSNGSSGAAHNYQKYYTIGEDGKSCEMFKYYYINSEDYYVEDIEGNILAFDDNFDQYLDQYEMETINWTNIDENSITENFIDKENMGTALTDVDIETAPIYKNGMLENSSPLFTDYFMKQVGVEDYYNTYDIRHDYEEQREDADVFDIYEEVSGNWLCTVVINTQTGDASATKMDGTTENFNILETEKADEGSTETEAAEESEIEIHFEHYYKDMNEGAIITGTDMNGNEVWTYQSGEYMGAQTQRVAEIGKNGNQYYFQEDGAIIALDVSTGEILWKNSEFTGSTSGIAFDGEGNLYLCGYLGPDLFVVSKDGQTLARVDSFSDSYFWPCNLELKGDGTLNITYEGGSGEYESGYLLNVKLSDIGIGNK